ncbi:MAG: phosphoribosylanthranilate isomerase [Phycisphaerales bacterium]|nr:phosphoribosylanthranilate isomerase [Phycisphaerales bacterium]
MTSAQMNHRTRIKICGIRDLDDAAAAIQAGADAIGLVFVESSPRHITPDAAAEIAMAMPPFVQSVGLVANMSPRAAEHAAITAQVNWLQVHGNETEAQLSSISAPIIRGFVFDAEQVRRWNACDAVDALLVDGSTGGQGQAFEWDALAAMMDEIDKPVIVAGGLTAENVAHAIHAVQPWAVDVSSGVETARGVKNPALMAEFCQAVREADRG